MSIINRKLPVFISALTIIVLFQPLVVSAQTNSELQTMLNKATVMIQNLASDIGVSIEENTVVNNPETESSNHSKRGGGQTDDGSEEGSDESQGGDVDFGKTSKNQQSSELQDRDQENSQSNNGNEDSDNSQEDLTKDEKRENATVASPPSNISLTQDGSTSTDTRFKLQIDGSPIPKIYSKNQMPERVRVDIALVAKNTAGATISQDSTPALYLRPEATPEWDAYDLSKLTPLSQKWAVIGPVGIVRNGDKSLKGIESQPMDVRIPLEIPLKIKTKGDIGGVSTIKAGDTWQNVPDSWMVRLIDTKNTSDPDDDVTHEITPNSEGYGFQIKS
jgi:hypothetical protein